MSISSLDLPELIDLLENTAVGRVPHDVLQAKLADRVMSPVVPVEDEIVAATSSQMLAYSVAERVCSMDRPGPDFAIFLRRILRCLGQISDPDDVHDLLPLIFHHDEFALLVSKHRRGVISAPGLKSIIRKRFTFDLHREWLERATPAQLSKLGEFIEADDYAGLRTYLLLTEGAG